MSKEHNLAVAKRGISLPETFDLDMAEYCTSTYENMPKANSCGTTFCFAGYLAAEDDYPEDFICNESVFNPFRYNEYSMTLLGIENSNEAWDFFFCSLWPSTFKDLKERCQCVIDNDGEIPEYFNSADNSWEGKDE